MGEGNSFQRRYAQNSSPSSAARLEFLMNVVPYTSSRSKPLGIEIHDEENWNSLENLLSACHLDNSSECVVSRPWCAVHLVIGTLDIPRIVKVHCLVRAIVNDYDDCHFTTFMTEFCVKSDNLEHFESNSPCGGVMSLAQAPCIVPKNSKIAFGPLAIYSDVKNTMTRPWTSRQIARDYVIRAKKILDCRRVSDFLHATRQLWSRDSDFVPFGILLLLSALSRQSGRRKAGRFMARIKFTARECVLCRFNSLWRVAPGED